MIVGGGNPGYISHLAMFPDDDLVIAHLTNINTTKLHKHVPYIIADRLLCLPKTQDWVEVSIEETQEFYDMVKGAYNVDLPAQRNVPPTHPLHEYVGEYSHPVYGDISIRLENEKNVGGEGEALYFKMRTLDGKLSHCHFDTFTVALEDFSLRFRAVVTFQTRESGQVESLQFILDSEIVEFKRGQRA